MGISLDSDGRAEIEPIVATPQAASGSTPVLSRHALRGASAQPAELEVEVSPPPRMPAEPVAAPRRAPSVPADAASPAVGAGAFWNLPNTITVLRAAAVPVLLLYPLFSGEFGSTVMAWI